MGRLFLEGVAIWSCCGSFAVADLAAGLRGSEKLLCEACLKSDIPTDISFRSSRVDGRVEGLPRSW
jgi:hypothetical protein